MIKNFLAIAICLLFTFSNASDNTLIGGVSLVVVDTYSIFEKADAMKKVRGQVDAKMETFKKEASEQEVKLNSKYEQLEKKKNVLSTEAYEKELNAFNAEFEQVQKKVQENRNSIDKAYLNAVGEFEKKLSEIVKEEADKRKVKIILHKAQALYSDIGLDITTELLEQVNKKIPTIKVTFDK